jgi:hypothetical protein
MRKINGFLILLFVLPAGLQAQGYLHAGGKYIYDGTGNEVILRGIGTGNWMLQEGYMMQSSRVAGIPNGTMVTSTATMVLTSGNAGTRTKQTGIR